MSHTSMPTKKDRYKSLAPENIELKTIESKAIKSKAIKSEHPAPKIPPSKTPLSKIPISKTSSHCVIPRFLTRVPVLSRSKTTHVSTCLSTEALHHTVPDKMATVYVESDRHITFIDDNAEMSDLEHYPVFMIDNRANNSHTAMNAFMITQPNSKVI